MDRLWRAMVGLAAIAFVVGACGSGSATANSAASATNSGPASATFAWLLPSPTQPPRKANVVVVGDSSGREIRRVQLPHEPILLYGTAASQTVLIEGMDTWMAANLATGVTQTLDFGDTSPLDMHPAVLGGRWWVLAAGSAGPAYLLDAQTGVLQDFASLGIKQLIAPSFSPGEAALAAHAPDLTLIETGQPAVVRAIGGGNGGSLAFSPDGKRIVYTTRRGATTSVVTEQMDGTNSHEVFTSAGAVRPEFTSDPNRLLIVDAKGIGLVDVATGKSTLVTDAAKIDTMTRIDWSADHAHAVVGFDDASGTQQWVEIDPAAGTGRVLKDLAGFQPLAIGSAAAMQVYDDTDSIAKPATFKVLDFATGTVRQVAGTDPTAGYLTGTAQVVGAHAIVATISNETHKMQVWLIDGAAGSAIKLDEGDSAQASFSRDGSAVISSRYDGKAFGLDLLDIVSGVKTSLGVGYGGVWLAP